MMKRTNLFVATATAALIAGSGMVLGQGMQGGDKIQGGGGAAVQHDSSGGGSMKKGSNARGEQGTLRSSEQPGDKGSNGRSAQGPDRSSKPMTTGQGQSNSNSLNAKGSNARDEQGTLRRSEQPGDKGSNARGAQGPDRSSRPMTTGQGRNELRERNELRDHDNSTQLKGQSSRSRTTGQGQVDRNETDRTRVNESGDRDRLRDRDSSRSSTRIDSDRTRVDTRADIRINDEQRSRIREVFVRHRDIPRVSHLDVELRPGVRLHRRVHFVAVPQDVIRIYPEFRRYRVFRTEDEIVIVEPTTLRIVAVLPA